MIAALLNWRAWAVLVLVAAAYFGYHAWADALRAEGAAPYVAAIASQKTEAAQKLATETDRTLATERQLQLALSTQNAKDAQNAQTLSDLRSRLDVAAGPAGRLRDPNAQAGCGGGGGSATGATAPSADPGATDAAQAGGLLSAQLTRVLQQLTEEADTINDAYSSCRADAYKVRGPGP